MRGDLTRYPENVATKVRQRVTLHCAGTNPVDWCMPVEGQTASHGITYAGEVLENQENTFSLNTDGGQFALVIKSTALSDGRVYRCKDVVDIVGHHADAEVIVFGKTCSYFS